MPKDLENFTPSEPKKDAKDALKGLHQQVETLSTAQQKAERKIGNHLKGILDAGGYLKEAHIDGTTKDILDARTEEEAVQMVNDLVSNFQHSLQNNPDLFAGLPKPAIFDAIFKEMLIHTDEGGNLYWDIDVVVNGDDIKVAAPVRLAG